MRIDDNTIEATALRWLLLYYSNFIAFVGSILDISIDGTTNIAVDMTKMAMFIGMSNQLNSMGTLFI